MIFLTAQYLKKTQILYVWGHMGTRFNGVTDGRGLEGRVKKAKRLRNTNFKK